MKIEDGSFSIFPVKIGIRSFVGNAAFVPGGTNIGNNSLIGVLSVPPGKEVPPGTTWLGSPSIFFPRRQECRNFSEELTYNPTKKLIIKRLGYEYFRVTLPATVSYLGTCALVGIAIHLIQTFSVPVASALIALGTFGVALVITLFVAALKWALVGKYVPRVKPMWSSFVWRSELITALYENLVVPWLLRGLTGSPFVAPILRLFGARVGKCCFIETTFLTEFDLVEIGDDCSIGLASSLQTHLFEDRVMKMSRLRIGKRCGIGPRSVILYDAILEDDVELDALSLVMKGETLRRGTCWHGSPSQQKT